MVQHFTMTSQPGYTFKALLFCFVALSGWLIAEGRHSSLSFPQTIRTIKGKVRQVGMGFPHLIPGAYKIVTLSQQLTSSSFILSGEQQAVSSLR